MDGIRIADRALAALRGATTSQVVVANDPSATSWFPDVRVVQDEQPGFGPLAGLATALAASGDLPIIVLAWDMPFVPAPLLLALRRRGSDMDAVIPVHDAQPEPLCAFYAAGALATCHSLLTAGERRAGVLAERLPRVAWLEDSALAPFGDPARIFTSVDTPERLAALGGVLP